MPLKTYLRRSHRETSGIVSSEDRHEAHATIHNAIPPESQRTLEEGRTCRAVLWTDDETLDSEEEDEAGPEAIKYGGAGRK